MGRLTALMKANCGMMSLGDCDCWLPVWLPDLVGSSGVRNERKIIGCVLGGGSLRATVSHVNPTRSVKSPSFSAKVRECAGDNMSGTSSPSSLRAVRYPWRAPSTALLCTWRAKESKDDRVPPHAGVVRSSGSSSSSRWLFLRSHAARRAHAFGPALRHVGGHCGTVSIASNRI